MLNRAQAFLVTERCKQNSHRLFKRYLQGYLNIHGYLLDNGYPLEY
jgi:hypothetical protein